MALDHLVGLPAKPRKIMDATLSHHRWLERCVAAFAESDRPRRGVLFGIVQGGMETDLRKRKRGICRGSDCFWHRHRWPQRGRNQSRDG